MRRTLIAAALILPTFAGGYYGRNAGRDHPIMIADAPAGTESHHRENDRDRRIVSLAPSITEILFSLGLGEQVAGVTRYCVYPREARTKFSVGGYYEPNYEAIMALQPDLVVMLPEHEEPQQHLGQLGLNTLMVDHRNVAGILTSITTIGTACGAERAARALVQDLQSQMERIRRKTERLPRPKVIISLGRNMGSGTLHDACISGRGGFYDEMIGLAGGVNAYDGAIAFPVVSRESIIRLDPEVIIDLIPDLDSNGWNKAAIQREWDVLRQTDALSRVRVHVFGEDYVVIPGPRFILFLTELARTIHPEVNWE